MLRPGGLLEQTRILSLGYAPPLGNVDPGGPESAVAFMMPWVAMLYAGLAFHLLPRMADEPRPLVLWVWNLVFEQVLRLGCLKTALVFATPLRANPVCCVLPNYKLRNRQ